MRRASAALTGAFLVGAFALLTGCVPDSSTPSASPTSAAPETPSVSVSTAAPTPSDSAATSAPVDPSTPASIPTSCDDLGTATTRQQTVGDLQPQHSSGFVRTAPANATTALACDWIKDESAGVLLIISTAAPADVTTGLAGLAGQGYTCQAAEEFGAQYCMKTETQSEDVVVARGDVWIYLETVNVNARAWLSEIVAQIFNV